MIAWFEFAEIEAIGTPAAPARRAAIDADAGGGMHDGQLQLPTAGMGRGDHARVGCRPGDGFKPLCIPSAIDTDIDSLWAALEPQRPSVNKSDAPAIRAIGARW